MSPAPGEIWLADLGMAAKTRPVLIVSRRDANSPRALIIYIPLTSQNRGSPYEVPMTGLPFLREESVANVQGIASLPLTRLERKLGQVPGNLLEKVRHYISIRRGALDFHTERPE